MTGGLVGLSPLYQPNLTVVTVIDSIKLTMTLTTVSGDPNCDNH